MKYIVLTLVLFFCSFVSLSADTIAQVGTSAENIKVQEDIRGLRMSGASFWMFFFGCFGFCSIVYIGFSFFITQRNKLQLQKMLIPVSQDEKNKHTISFLKLEKQLEILSSQDFFRQYNSKIRKIFLERGISMALTATLQELKQDKRLQQDDLFEIFQRSYFGEYDSEEISLSEKKDFMKNILSLL